MNCPICNRVEAFTFNRVIIKCTCEAWLTHEEYKGVAILEILKEAYPEDFE